MLATGASAIEAINSLKIEVQKNIRFMCLIAAPEGVEKCKKRMKMLISILQL